MRKRNAKKVQGIISTNRATNSAVQANESSSNINLANGKSKTHTTIKVEGTAKINMYRKVNASVSMSEEY